MPRFTASRAAARIHSLARCYVNPSPRAYELMLMCLNDLPLTRVLFKAWQKYGYPLVGFKPNLGVLSHRSALASVPRRHNLAMQVTSRLACARPR